MSEQIRILYPDVLSRDEHAVERAAVDDTVAFDIFNEKDADKIPNGVWRGVHGMVTGIGMPLGADVMARLEKCKIITRLGVGYDLIDTAAAGARGIVVCNVPDYGTNEVSDHAFALILNFTRGIGLYNEAFRDDPKDGWNYLVSPTTVRIPSRCSNSNDWRTSDATSSRCATCTAPRCSARSLVCSRRRSTGRNASLENARGPCASPVRTRFRSTC